MPEYFQPSEMHPGRILVVDDLPGNLKVLAMELKRMPFTLVFATSGEEAVDCCRTQRFEGILMDVSMHGGIDGIEACRRIRALPLNARTPIIFISAVRVGTDWITAGIEAGGIDYLVKPYALPELVVKLRMMVRLSRQGEAALAGERNRALLEVAGGTAHELAQPLAAAQILVDGLRRSAEAPSASQLENLHACMDNVGRVLRKIQHLHDYITKPYAEGRILDLDRSSGALAEGDLPNVDDSLG